MKGICLAPSSVFISRLHLQRASMKVRGNHYLQYHLYLVPEILQLVHTNDFSLRRDLKIEGKQLKDKN